MGRNQNELMRWLRVRERFLAEHPHLKPMQSEIDRVLEEAGDNPDERLRAVFDMLLDQLNQELLPNTHELLELAETAKKKVSSS